MTEKIIRMPGRAVREAVVEARKDAKAIDQYAPGPEGWRGREAQAAALAKISEIVRKELRLPAER